MQDMNICFRPAPAKGSVSVHDIKYAGKSVSDKLAEIRGELAKLSAQAMAVTALDEVSSNKHFLMNIVTYFYARACQVE
jgi:hypothetical protein